jgi:hypothetical protein
MRRLLVLSAAGAVAWLVFARVRPLPVVDAAERSVDAGR